MNLEGKDSIDTQSLSSLKKIIDENNVLEKNIWKARDKYESGDSFSFILNGCEFSSFLFYN